MMTPLTIPVMAAALLAAPQTPSRSGPARPVNDRVTIDGCLRGTTLIVVRTDATDLTGAREARLVGSRSLLAQLEERNHQFVEVTGVLEREGGPGASDAIETRREKKLGGRTTVFLGGKAEQGTGAPSPETRVRLTVEGFSPIADTCPAAK